MQIKEIMPSDFGEDRQPSSPYLLKPKVSNTFHLDFLLLIDY